MLRRIVIISVLMVFSLTFVLIPSPTYAATYTAGNASELVDAITAANAAPDPDFILLTNNIILTTPADTYTLYGNTGLPIIDTEMTIEGQGFTIERDINAPEMRIFRVMPGGNLTLVNLTIRNGFQLNSTTGTLAGGGIYNAAIVTLLHCAVLDNTVGWTQSYGGFGGGIYNDIVGTLTLIDSKVEGNFVGSAGGGIYSYARNSTTSIIDSRIVANHSEYYGGGLMSEDLAPMVISNSVISGNDAFHQGGGIFNYIAPMTISGSIIANNTVTQDIGQGGGIFNGSQATLTISNSTIFNNEASGVNGQGGSLYNNLLSTADLVNTTISDNYAAEGGAYYSDGGSTADFTNSIIRHSTGGNCAGSDPTSGTFNLADDLSCAGFTRSTSIKLGTIANNGGPHFTLMPMTGSSALDTADNIACSSSPVDGVDERGVKRGINSAGEIDSPQVGDCDIGSVEADGVVPTLQFTSANTSFDYPPPTTATVTLTLSSPLEVGYAPITTYIWISGGTALAGTDYPTFGLQTVTFNPGESTKNITLDWFGSLTTADKTVILSIANQNGPGFSGPAKLGTNRTHTLTFKASPPLAAPALNVYNTMPVLKWNLVFWAAGYEVQVSTKTTFALPYAFHDDTIPADQLNIPTSGLSDGTYYWRVRAKDSAGKWGAWSEVQTFTLIP